MFVRKSNKSPGVAGAEHTFKWVKNTYVDVLRVYYILNECIFARYPNALRIRLVDLLFFFTLYR